MTGVTDQAPPAWTPPPQPDPVTRLAMRLWGRSPLWLAPAAILGCMGAATAYTLISDPTQAAASDSPTCLLKYTTGFVCPGCGGTRAFYYLLQADLPAAARHHAVFVFAVPFLVWLYVAWAVNRVAGRRVLPELRLGGSTVAIFMGVWGVWSLLRNLPWAPFTWFAV